MKVGLQFALSDEYLPVNASVNQRQLAVSLCAIPDRLDSPIPLNLCLALDHSRSMAGRPLEMVQQAVQQLLTRLGSEDRLSIIGFNHKANVLVPNQTLENRAQIRTQIAQLQASGGTAIDEGLHLAIAELTKGRKGTVSQLLLLTDGENEHGDNERCLKLAHQATTYNLTLNTLGLGEYWNQDVLEQIADTGGGSLSYIQHPDEVLFVFNTLLERVRAIGLTDSYLLISLMPQVRLASYKPVSQVAPETIELPVFPDGEWLRVRLGDLMTEPSRVILVNFYIHQLPLGQQPILKLQVRYDAPGLEGKAHSDCFVVTARVVPTYHPAPNPQVQQHILALAKYRQTQIAEAKLRQGDRAAAMTMLQAAVTTALQLGDQHAAIVLQDNITQLRSGAGLSEAAQKRTRMAAKTTILF